MVEITEEAAISGNFRVGVRLCLVSNFAISHISLLPLASFL
jgi:hypothetical protein